jgi:hypothetical protein
MMWQHTQSWLKMVSWWCEFVEAAFGQTKRDADNVESCYLLRLFFD